jgi:hypothetical protein
MVFSLISNLSADALGTLDKQINREVRNGKIKKISAIDLLTNVRSLTVFPFLLKGIQMKSLKLTEEQMNLKLKARKQTIVELVWNSLKKQSIIFFDIFEQMFYLGTLIVNNKPLTSNTGGVIFLLPF